MPVIKKSITIIFGFILMCDVAKKRFINLYSTGKFD